MNISESTHRQNVIDTLTETIRQRATDEGLSFAAASSRVLLEWLGYDGTEISFLDSRDRGVDAWFATESGIDIFQIKTHELNRDDVLDLSPFDGQGVRDLERAKNLLLTEQPNNLSQKSLKELLYRRDSMLRTRNLQSDQSELPIILHLVVLGNGLTPEAKSEFASLEATVENPLSVDGVPVQFYPVLHTIDDVLNARWREDNRSWLNRDSQKMENIILHPWNEGVITDHANAIFYCRAIDLVNAYDQLGYQLFEPNVRANIKNSKVNQAIKESVLHQRTRREFRFLNNGVTIICENFNLTRDANRHFRVRHPGVVNGLQTVVALHSAYGQLSSQEKTDFEKHCAVLVRLLFNNVVDDITRVVKSTNNQNPMKARNLMSNTVEQLQYARSFAQDLGWFYEAKEGAWDAFEKDHKRWRPRLNKHPKDFRIPNSRKVRRIDNEDLAQIWLAFIGLANEAINERKSLFDDRYYDLIFKHQTTRHAFDYDFSLNRVRENAINQSPNPKLMLVAHLAREFANEVIPTPAKNRQAACERLGLDPNLPKIHLDPLLSQDSEFILYQALSGMSVLFAEFIGFVFFRAFGENVHRYGDRIIQNHSFYSMAFESFDVVKDRVGKQQINPNDLLVVLWYAFVDTVEDMLASTWGQSYRAATVKVRFTFSRDSRERLYRVVEDTNEFMKKRSLKKTWAVGVADRQGLFDFVKSCVL